MPKPRSKPDKPLLVRIPPELVVRIDELRDLAPVAPPREAFIRYLLERALAAEERKAKRR